MLVIVMGVSGSGKSTIAAAVAKELNWLFLDADKFHPKSNIDKMKKHLPLTDHDRNPWLLTLHVEINKHQTDQQHVVVACSALKKAYRNLLLHGSKTQIDQDQRTYMKKGILLVYLKGDEALIHSRMVKRSHFMPPSLIQSQFKDLEEPTSDELHIVIDIMKTESAIVREITEYIKSLQSRY